jgi:MFS family permease
MKGIPRTVWALGFVSMFMDISSEMIHSLLPVFLVTVLHAGTVSVGLIEGASEAVALMAKTFSGALSDWLGRRKALLFIGYAIGTATKPLFALAAGVPLVFAARFIDRIGKGIRGAPRDALVADATPTHLRGAAFGLRQSLDTVGAFVGPLLAVLFMWVAAGDFRKVFWIAVIPGTIALVLILFGVRESSARATESTRRPIHFSALKELGSAFWMVLLFGAIFTLARFSEAFLLLRAQSVGMAAGTIPFVLVVMNVAYSLTAYPVGKLSDRVGRTGLLTAGLALLIAADLVLALGGQTWQISCGAVLWGVHMGLTQGLLAAMVADTAVASLRGTAFGIYGLACGVAVLGGNLITGLLWSVYGPRLVFEAGALLAGVTLLGYLLLQKVSPTAGTPVAPAESRLKRK